MKKKKKEADKIQIILKGPVSIYNFGDDVTIGQIGDVNTRSYGSSTQELGIVYEAGGLNGRSLLEDERTAELESSLVSTVWGYVKDTYETVTKTTVKVFKWIINKAWARPDIIAPFVIKGLDQFMLDDKISIFLHNIHV